jgi:hypothetical protein
MSNPMRIVLSMSVGLTLFGIAMAQNVVQVAESGVLAKTFALNEIVKVKPNGTNLEFYTVASGANPDYVAPALGQKWTFASSSSTTPVAVKAQNLTWSVEGQRLTVRNTAQSQFGLYSVDGKEMATSKSDALEWSVELSTEQVQILRVRESASEKSYLIRY